MGKLPPKAKVILCCGVAAVMAVPIVMLYGMILDENARTETPADDFRSYEMVEAVRTGDPIALDVLNRMESVEQAAKFMGVPPPEFVGMLHSDPAFTVSDWCAQYKTVSHYDGSLIGSNAYRCTIYGTGWFVQYYPRHVQDLDGFQTAYCDLNTCDFQGRRLLVP